MNLLQFFLTLLIDKLGFRKAANNGNRYSKSFHVNVRVFLSLDLANVKPKTRGLLVWGFQN